MYYESKEIFKRKFVACTKRYTCLWGRTVKKHNKVITAISKQTELSVTDENLLSKPEKSLNTSKGPILDRIKLVHRECLHSQTTAFVQSTD